MRDEFAFELRQERRDERFDFVLLIIFSDSHDNYDPSNRGGLSRSLTMILTNETPMLIYPSLLLKYKYFSELRFSNSRLALQFRRGFTVRLNKCDFDALHGTKRAHVRS